MPYISREGGKIVGAFSRKQYTNQELISDINPEYILFRDGDPLKNKRQEIIDFVNERTEQLSNPLDLLRTTVIIRLQGDRARGKPLNQGLQKILDDVENDTSKVLAETLLIAADDILLNIDAVTDVIAEFAARGIN